MKFIEAWELFEDGCAIKRKNWPFFIQKIEFKESPAIGRSKGEGRFDIWSLGAEDMFSDDWSLAEEQPEEVVPLGTNEVSAEANKKSVKTSKKGL